MMYNFVLKLYVLAIKIASLKNKKAKQWIHGRKNWKTNLEYLCNNFEEIIWIHCSSYGEYQDGQYFISKLKNLYPSSKILLSFFSPSGYENLKNKIQNVDAIIYLPIDTIDNAISFIKIVNPKKAFFIRNDIWCNYINELYKLEIPCYLINFNYAKGSLFFTFLLKKFYTNVFKKISFIYTINNHTTTLLLNNNIKNSITIGNTRLDTILLNKRKHIPIKNLESFIADNFCIVCGSALPQDLKIIANTIKKLNHLNLKWIIVPHEINENDFKQFCIFNIQPILKFSEFKNSNTSILWVDTIGLLSSIYQYSNLSFIGGGFNSIGIHNILEPAAYGNTICFGPKHRNYIEALDLININVAHIIENENHFIKLIEKLYNDRSILKANTLVIEDYLSKSSGAVNKILSHCFTLNT